MSSLLTNISAMNALTTLKSINRDLDTTLNRITTGLRVATASDDAAYWSIATTVRTDNKSLNAVKDVLGLGAATVDTTYNGLTSAIDDMKELRSKLTAATAPNVDRSKVQVEIAAIQSKMKATADSSVMSGQNWLSVDSRDAGYKAQQELVAGFSRNPSGNIDFSSITVDVDKIKLYDAARAGVAIPATPAKVTAGKALSPTMNLSGSNEASFSIRLNGGLAQTIALNASTMAAAVPDLTKVSRSELLDAINNQIAANATLRENVRASLDSAGRLSFETVGEFGFGASASITIENVAPTSSGAATNVISNGGFEGALSGWTRSGAFDHTSVSSVPHSGAFGFRAGSVGGEAILTQSVPTVAGAAYSLDFWLANGTGNPNNFSVNWNGTVLMSLTDSASQPYTHYQFDVVGADTNSALEFVFRQDPSYWNLDDVSVTSMDNQLIDIGFGTGVADARTGYGTDAVGTRDRGILDTVDLRTGFSIQTLNIADLSGAAGDEALGDMITQVDKALARMTDAATALGAGKTQIAGQATFVEALIKANERSIGILVDADIEEEATRLKALQAQQQLGIQSLSIANASSQGITSLFR